MTAHTPGPWHVPFKDSPHWSKDQVPVAAADGGIVASVEQARRFAQADANARLIAAAPDLLVVTRSLVAAMVEYDMDVGGDVEPPTKHTCMMRAARAAIAKAEGSRA